MHLTIQQMKCLCHRGETCAGIARRQYPESFFSAMMEEMKSEKLSELLIDQILAFGKEWAVNGNGRMQIGKNMFLNQFCIYDHLAL